jgi:hypothetical protein
MSSSKNQIVVYQPNETVRLDVRLENETVWLTQELIVIDAYPGVVTLDMLAKRGRGVKIELVTHSNGELEDTDFEAFGAQCGKFTKTICGICHDRFIIVDQKEIFWIGASLKDAGRLTFAARMLAHPSGSAFAESSLRNASHFFGTFRRWARRSFQAFSIQSARRRQKVLPIQRTNPPHQEVGVRGEREVIYGETENEKRRWCETDLR